MWNSYGGFSWSLILCGRWIIVSEYGPHPFEWVSSDRFKGFYKSHGSSFVGERKTIWTSYFETACLSPPRGTGSLEPLGLQWPVIEVVGQEVFLNPHFHDKGRVNWQSCFLFLFFFSLCFGVFGIFRGVERSEKDLWDVI